MLFNVEMLFRRWCVQLGKWDKATLVFKWVCYIWERLSVVNEREFINMFVQRVEDQYAQLWYGRISTSSKLMAYTGFKYMYEHESYLHCMKIRKFRRILAQFRVIEKGRYSIERTERIC